jgi:hypothetical protein
LAATIIMQAISNRIEDDKIFKVVAIKGAVSVEDKEVEDLVDANTLEVAVVWVDLIAVVEAILEAVHFLTIMAEAER